MLQSGHVHDIDCDIDVPVDLESPGEAQASGLKAEDSNMRSHQSHVADSFNDSEIGDQPPVTRTGATAIAKISRLKFALPTSVFAHRFQACV